ncbi:MAG: MmgE/PrpD family protein [Blautia sp.]|nr:MmgE/PrpD family protein [Blautia sp.]
MNISAELARFVAETNYEDIPEQVIESQKKSLMDGIAITFGAGALGDGCREMIRIAEDLSAHGEAEATVIGFDRKLPAIWAAFANAAMAHSLDFGDTHQGSTIHSNSSSMPAALALAERLGGVGGKEFLAALVLGSETAIRIALAADTNSTEDGFYPPTIYSSYGATAAAAKILGLSKEQIVSAMSFNLCQTFCSSELTNNKRTAVRSVREAFAARNAIVSCYMAKENMIGFSDPLEGKLGFYHTFLHDRYTPERALAGLGSRYEAADLTFKAWPCCFGTHSAITAARKMMAEGLFTAEEVRHIQVSVGAQNRMLFEPIEERRNPESSMIGKFSIPFTLAEAILKGNVTLNSFSEENLHDERVRALAARIDYTYMEEWQRGKETWTRLAVETDHGTFERMETMPLGTPGNPMDEETFDQKFFSCASLAENGKDREEIRRIRDHIKTLENTGDIREFTALL